MADSFSIGGAADALPRREGRPHARALKGVGMVQKAKEARGENGWFLAHQFETEANAAIHASTTAREILGDFDGKRLTTRHGLRHGRHADRRLGAS